MDDKEPIPTSEFCIHGKLYGDCNPCDLAADLAFDEFCKEPKPLIIDEEAQPRTEPDTP
jgi:hypothetical protein